MRYLPALMCFALVLLGGCAGAARSGEATAGKPAAAKPAPPIGPGEVAAALASLAEQVQLRTNLACTAIEQASPHNDTRRQTLRWRLRTAEVCRKARYRDNAMAGLIELWYWMAAAERHLTTGKGKERFGAQQALAVEAVQHLRGSTEAMVARAVPKDRFPSLRQQIEAATEQGDAFLAGDNSHANPLGSLLEVTRLESVLDLAMSPFDAFGGVKSGGDAMARLAVTADRAVDVLADYPQILDWHLQAAAIELQDQDTMRELLAEVKRTNTSIEATVALARGLPAQIRQEGMALLDQSRPAQADVRETLKALTDAANALERLNSGIDRLVGRFDQPEDPGRPAEPPGRPFDIREYTTALNAAAVTARDLQQTLAATERLLASPAIPSRIGEADQAAHGLIHAIGLWSIALVITLAACVVATVRLLRR